MNLSLRKNEESKAHNTGPPGPAGSLLLWDTLELWVPGTHSRLTDLQTWESLQMRPSCNLTTLQGFLTLPKLWETLLDVRERGSHNSLLSLLEQGRNHRTKGQTGHGSHEKGSFLLWQYSTLLEHTLGSGKTNAQHHTAFPTGMWPPESAFLIRRSSRMVLLLRRKGVEERVRQRCEHHTTTTTKQTKNKNQPSILPNFTYRPCGALLHQKSENQSSGDTSVHTSPEAIFLPFTKKAAE